MSDPEGQFTVETNLSPMYLGRTPAVTFHPTRPDPASRGAGTGCLVAIHD